MLMDGVGYNTQSDEGFVKTFAPPDVLAAILDPEQSLETRKYTEENGPEFASKMENLDTEQNISKIGYFGVDGIENGRPQGDFLQDSLNDSVELEITDSLEGQVLDNRISTPQSENSHDVSLVNVSNNSQEIVLPEQKPSRQKSDFQNGENKTKERSSDVKTKPTPKSKRNFIDKNRDISKRSGNNGYAARFQQKVKLKQAKDAAKHGKVNGESANSNKIQQENVQTLNQNSEHYDNFDLTASSSLIGNQYGSYSRTNSYGGYSNAMNNNYNPENAYSRASMNYMSPSQMGHVYQGSTMDQYQYLNQPYQTPYRDFGLRYSNFGQRGYNQPSSAMTYPYQSRPLPPIAQGYGSYASQSAPPGVPYYARQPLIDRVEFFPEHDYDLSLTLPNSSFVSGQQRFQYGGMLQRRFLSEPQLSHSPSPKPEGYGQERGSKASGSYNSPRQPVDYKPYTLKDYRHIKEKKLDQLGSLGPDVDSDEHREKINKMNKQKEYAEMLRNHHASLKPYWEKNAAPIDIPPARQKQAEAKRKAAINYAKTVPKPKLMSSRRTHVAEPHSEDEAKDVTLVELLKMRHEKEKNDVDVIRKDIAAKIRQ